MLQTVVSSGYQPANEVRQGYTRYEQDHESGLDFAQARYYNSTHGRFTSIDPLIASANVKNPQTFNRYSYVLNAPYKYSDPLGLISQNTGACGNGCANSGGYVDGSAFRGRDATSDWTKFDDCPPGQDCAGEATNPSSNSNPDPHPVYQQAGEVQLTPDITWSENPNTQYQPESFSSTFDTEGVYLNDGLTVTATLILNSNDGTTQGPITFTITGDGVDEPIMGQGDSSYSNTFNPIFLKKQIIPRGAQEPVIVSGKVIKEGTKPGELIDSPVPSQEFPIVQSLNMRLKHNGTVRKFSITLKAWVDEDGTPQRSSVIREIPRSGGNPSNFRGNPIN